MSANVLLEVKHLSQFFRIDRHTTIRAVDDVSFHINEGETFSVVGESGSGKSTLGRTLIRIYDAHSGSVNFMGKEIGGKLNSDSRKFLRKNMQMIFQDPMASLNPRKKVLDAVAFGLDINHLSGDKDERLRKVVKVLKSVGLSEDHLTRYPHQFSGGQRQRIGVARALIMEPRFIICDEIISALDVSIQAQVINLMRRLQKEHGLTYMFIAHDLSMVRYLSDRVAVMHLGHIVEMGTVEDIYEHPLHPYTKSLLSAIPHPDPDAEKDRKRFVYIKGGVDYNIGTIRQLSDTHSILATDEEFSRWQQNDYSLFLK
ncbi:MAG: ATP-binding cassette domain-containing protein [Erysipelotrichaceae bacterium]|nr:ATP-binding cassette domain-containing protein [Erysipelotrichaceae bacterium]